MMVGCASVCVCGGAMLTPPRGGPGNIPSG